MQLFVMRHGQASEFAKSDSTRELTEQGHLEAKVMAKWLNDSHIIFDHIFVSPYTRAQQTAKSLLSVLNHAAPLKTVDFITPSGNAVEVHDYIDGVSQVEKFEHVLIISHMPLVSYLVAELTFDNNAPIFQTAAIAQIQYNKAKMKGDLVKLISPYDLC